MSRLIGTSVRFSLCLGGHSHHTLVPLLFQAPALIPNSGYVGKKGEPRWLWHAIDHHSGTVLAYVFGRRKDAVFLQLQALLEPFGITRFYTDGWGAYERHIAPEQHHVGKENTQKIESKHINLRTRIKRFMRRTLGFSKTERRHRSRHRVVHQSLRIRVPPLIWNQHL